MKIILYGSEGTIGNYVKKEIIKKKITLYVYENKKKIKSNKNYKIINKNHLKDKNFINEQDILIYLAWGNLNDFDSNLHIKKEYPTHFANIKKLVKQGIKNIIVTGTCFEYKKKDGILTENSTINPSTNYGIAKNKLRKKLSKLKETYNINLNWLRIFYIYGNENDNNNLWSQLIKFSDQKKIKYFKMSSGKQSRDYMHVKDIAKNIVFIALKRNHYGVVNICSGKPIQIKSLVKKWRIKYKWNMFFKYNHYDIPKYESFKFWGSNKKLKKIVGKTYEQK